MSRSPTIRCLSFLVLAGLLAACGKEPPPAAEASIPEVEVVTLEAERLALSRELPGRAAPFLVAEVRPQVTGIVKERLFEEGGEVEAGQALYQLDDATYQADYHRFEAMLARARTSLELARVSAGRATELSEATAISKQEFDNSIAALSEAEANVAVAEAEAQASKVLLDYSRIVAPISGRIGKSSVTKGALVTANQAQPLATIQRLDPIYIDVTQSSSELLQLRRALAEGNLQDAELPVNVLLEDGARYEHSGKVAFSEVTVEPTTGRYSLRVVVPNPDELLLPGMYLRAEIGMGVRQQAILVPQRAVSRGASGETTALVLGPNDTLEQRIVSISRAVGNKWLVESGLEAGDRVVTAGLQKVQPGTQVKVAASAAAN